jgi:hypothetical protein
MAAIVLNRRVGAKIMKKLTRAQLFVAPNKVLKAEARLKRGKSAIVAAREHAAEITERRAAQPFRMHTTVWTRRRLAERLKALAMV